MQDTKKMVHEAQVRAQRMGNEYQKAAERGFEAATRSFSGVNQGFQALAAEVTDYSKRTFDDTMRTCEQLIGVKSLEQAAEIQSQYVRRLYDNHMAELSKLGQMYLGMVRDASKPVEQASKRLT